ncbi:MAG: hypothetical protein ACREAA_03185 [Candidatus Polarisedimenticolia bacterium]
MITGYNTDVKHDGLVFHVQTEDKGLSNPTIESLIYAGGKIVASRQYSYAWLVRQGYDEKVVQDLLDCQHRKMMRDIHGGKYSPGGPPPFGAGLISERGFDELVLEFLGAHAMAMGLEIVVTEPPLLRAGDLAVLDLLVRKADGGAPERSAHLTVKAVIGPEGSARSIILFEGAADAEGKAKAGVEIPRDAAGGTLVIEAAGRKGASAEAAFQIEGS